MTGRPGPHTTGQPSRLRGISLVETGDVQRNMVHQKKGGGKTRDAHMASMTTGVGLEWTWEDRAVERSREGRLG